MIRIQGIEQMKTRTKSRKDRTQNTPAMAPGVDRISPYPYSPYPRRSSEIV